MVKYISDAGALQMLLRDALCAKGNVADRPGCTFRPQPRDFCMRAMRGLACKRKSALLIDTARPAPPHVRRLQNKTFRPALRLALFEVERGVCQARAERGRRGPRWHRRDQTTPHSPALLAPTHPAPAAAALQARCGGPRSAHSEASAGPAPRGDSGSEARVRPEEVFGDVGRIRAKRERRVRRSEMAEARRRKARWKTSAQTAPLRIRERPWRAARGAWRRLHEACN